MTGMRVEVNGVPVHCAEHGSGVPVLALHGAGVDHREISAALEPVFAGRTGYRRLYPDLPGMGRTPAPPHIDGNDAVVELLLGLVDAVAGDRAVLLVGHSYGGYLARAVANRRPRQFAGLALICPADATTGDRPEHAVLRAADLDLADLDLADLEPAQRDAFRGYFVLHTPETLHRFRTTVAPANALVDEPALTRVFGHWQLSTAPEQGPAYRNPTLIVAGRQDSMVGYEGAWSLLPHYPRASFAVLDLAGHALPHEQAPLLAALLTDWLDRVPVP